MLAGSRFHESEPYCEDHQTPTSLSRALAASISTDTNLSVARESWGSARPHAWLAMLGPFHEVYDFWPALYRRETAEQIRLGLSLARPKDSCGRYSCRPSYHFITTIFPTSADGEQTVFCLYCSLASMESNAPWPFKSMPSPSGLPSRSTHLYGPLAIHSRMNFPSRSDSLHITAPSLRLKMAE
jgi:hypothetical protein